MQKFVVATKNKGKLSEIREILNQFQFDVASMEDIGIIEDIDETGQTFEENALIKAKSIYDRTKTIVMADDSGLEVDYLNGAPGIYSARYAGEGATDRDKINKLLKALQGVPFEKRTARFVCAMAVVLSETEYFIVKGIFQGYIGFEPKGENGFGYDPIFYVPQFDKTAAELTAQEKHSVSHRGQALRLMIDKLKIIY